MSAMAALKDPHVRFRRQSYPTAGMEYPGLAATGLYFPMPQNRL
jgi:hypothetical protein